MLGIEKKDLPNSKEKPLYQAIPTALYNLNKYKWLLISRKKVVKFILYYIMYKGIPHHKSKSILQNC